MKLGEIRVGVYHLWRKREQRVDFGDPWTFSMNCFWFEGLGEARISVLVVMQSFMPFPTNLMNPFIF